MDFKRDTVGFFSENETEPAFLRKNGLKPWGFYLKSTSTPIADFRMNLGSEAGSRARKIR